jgi:hypothetical protein
LAFIFGFNLLSSEVVHLENRRFKGKYLFNNRKKYKVLGLQKKIETIEMSKKTKPSSKKF